MFFSPESSVLRVEKNFFLKKNKHTKRSSAFSHIEAFFGNNTSNSYCILKIISNMMAKPAPVDPQILLLFKYAEQVQALHPDHPISNNLPDLYVTGETQRDRVKK
jgi:hypothetical protein